MSLDVDLMEPVSCKTFSQIVKSFVRLRDSLIDLTDAWFLKQTEYVN